MTTATLRISTPLPAAGAAKAKPAKGWWSRFFDRMMEARMRQAEIELRRHIATLPPHLIGGVDILGVTGRRPAKR